MRRIGVDCSVVVMKRGNTRGAKGAGHRRFEDFLISWQIQIGRPRGSDSQRNHEAGNNAEKHAEPAFAKRPKHVRSAPHLAAPSPMIENGAQNAK
jgi:hypothetical protein